ncbi:BTB/POZ domain-containing protein At1g63850-like [Aristolochia californica]|uniref:BTB/POZ domain-containing protein At1g63850-like n=1 Tax=Aristolochia californica TaxID=171875 RepID=UPI0035E3237B
MAATALLKTQTLHKSKRRKSRETTISATAAPVAETPHQKPPVVASDGAWCCNARLSPLPPPPPPLSPSQSPSTPPAAAQEDAGPVSFFSRSPSPVRVASPVVMDSPAGYAPYPASYTKFNTALNAGLLNPMSPPLVLDKTRSSPTLFEMMTNEQDCQSRQPIPVGHPPPSNGRSVVSVQDRQLQLQERITEILGSCSPGNQFNDASSSDVRVTLSSKDGLSIMMNVHRQILVAHSRFFAAKLSDRWSKQQRSLPHIVEISDCDDVEIYMETLRLMYCKDLRRKLMKEDVSKVLGILKVSAAIVFDAGVLSCLEYLEAAPWAEDEEEKVASVLAQLRLEGAGAGEVLKRVSVEVPVTEEGNHEEILLRLLQVVLEGKDEKARRDMKGLVSKMLRENSSHNDLSNESLYSACDSCLQLLRSHLLAAADGTGPFDIGQISRQADNLHWILDILIDRQCGEEFTKTWAGQGELAAAHSRVPVMHRYELSRVTARLFVGIGKGQVLVSKEVRCLLLRTWLEPFYDDFGWMRRACKGLDRHLVEDGLSNTILTLPLTWQQEILLAWFDRFLNSGEDCPNIQRAFEVWWRRAFWKRNGEPDRPRQLRIVAACENS